MKYNFSFINVHNPHSFTESLHNLSGYMYMMQMQPSDPQKLTDPHNILYMSSQTENWLKDRLCVSSLLFIYEKMGLFIPNWTNDDENSNFILADNGRFIRAETFSTSERLVLYSPANPRVFFFSIRRSPKLIEYNDIQPVLRNFSNAVMVRMQEDYPLSISSPYYLDPYYRSSISCRYKEGAFDLDLAAISILLLFPNAEIVVDIDERILYNTNYSGYFIEAVKRQLNKYE